MENKINRTVTLPQEEQIICKAIAKKRYENNRKENVKNSKIGKQSNEFTDLEGFAAEVAFCKLFNLFPDFSIYTRTSKTDDKGDVLLNNLKIDVKATKYRNGKLLAVTWKVPNIDFFALMIGEFPRYTFKGFMACKELLSNKRLGDLGYGQTYIASQEELKEMYELQGVTNERLS